MEFWAKTDSEGNSGIDVFHHLLNVGYVAKTLLNDTILKILGLDPLQCAAIAALHDIGKISPGFQSKCEKWIEKYSLNAIARKEYWNRQEKDHAKVGKYHLEKFFQEIYKENGFKQYSANFLASAIASHHGKLLGVASRPSHEPTGAGYWKEEINQTINEIIHEFKKPDAIPVNDHGMSAALFFVAGLTTLADWIGSDENFFPNNQNLDVDEIKVRAEKAVDSLRIGQIQVQKNLAFENIFQFSANEMQKKTLQTIQKPGIYIIEAPMGMGKTEAALGAAYQLFNQNAARGLYFALPTQTTSNRIFLRVKDFLMKIGGIDNQTKLIHGNSWLVESDLNELEIKDSLKPEEEKREIEQWFHSSKRALLAPVGVGTVDQALLSVVAAKHFFLRQFALAGKVVILDEVHSYDVYTGTLISLLCKTLVALGATVIILSATLTEKRRNEILGENSLQNNDYPLITGKPFQENLLAPVAAEPPETKTFKVFFKDRETIIKESIEKAKQGVCVLWVCDTVNSAQDTYKKIKKDTYNSVKIGLLHSRYPFFRRDDLENEWIEYLGKNNKNREGCILVSTQIVEQSIDIDADLLISELAPSDMLLQRLGREWRHQRTDRKAAEPEFWIIKEEAELKETFNLTQKEIKEVLGSKAHVYHPFVLLKSWQEWEKRTEVKIPLDIRAILEATYDDEAEIPDGWKGLLDDLNQKKNEMQSKAQLAANFWGNPSLEDEEGVQTRLIKNDQYFCLLYTSINDPAMTLLDGKEIGLNPKNYTKETGKIIHR
ncbi:MAG TPA: hypothetical protein DHW82_05645, partial [Spirochaetia bacterium]|nr:hypothetical protein [Spirochaetia bacterium]